MNINIRTLSWTILTSLKIRKVRIFSVLGTLHPFFAERALNSFVLKNSKYGTAKDAKMSFKLSVFFEEVWDESLNTRRNETNKMKDAIGGRQRIHKF